MKLGQTLCQIFLFSFSFTCILFGLDHTQNIKGFETLKTASKYTDLGSHVKQNSVQGHGLFDTKLNSLYTQFKVC